jgi:ATP-dependent Clp protease ATP-binding subunit ClpA
VGAPPGYVGYEEGGQLTEKIRKKPYSVILLDEIEKAHPDVFNILLQIMDYATLTDANGRKADFRNIVLVMTSNAGARDMKRLNIGFEGGARRRDAVDKAVEKTFSPEFRNRLDAVVHFASLSRDVIRDIAAARLKDFGGELKVKKIRLDASADCAEWIADRAVATDFGAREAQRIIQEKIKKPCADEILFGKLIAGGSVEVRVKKGELHLVFRKKK